MADLPTIFGGINSVVKQGVESYINIENATRRNAPNLQLVTTPAKGLTTNEKMVVGVLAAAGIGLFVWFLVR